MAAAFPRRLLVLQPCGLLTEKASNSSKALHLCGPREMCRPGGAQAGRCTGRQMLAAQIRGPEF